MKFTTLTSSLVLSLILAGSETIAMDFDEAGSGMVPLTPVITAEDLLSQSMIDPEGATHMMVGLRPDATPEQQQQAREAAENFTKKISLRKQAKMLQVVPTLDTLSLTNQQAVQEFKQLIENESEGSAKTTVPLAPVQATPAKESPFFFSWFSLGAWWPSKNEPSAVSSATPIPAIEIPLVTEVDGGSKLVALTPALTPLVEETPAMPTVVAPTPVADEIGDPFEEVTVKLNPTGLSEKVEEQDGEITVVTDTNNSASYQLESEPIPVTPGDVIQVTYRVTIAPNGAMSLGMLNTGRDDWYDANEKVLRTGDSEETYSGTCEWMVSEGEKQTSLVFRNYHLDHAAQTTFKVHTVKVMKKLR